MRLSRVPVRIAWMALLALTAIAPSRAARADSDAICGRYDESGPFPILSVWGTPRERGIAQGHFLAPRIKFLFEDYLGNAALSGGAKRYNDLLDKFVHPPFVVTSPRMRAEIQGIVEGMTRRLGADGMRMPALDRPIDERDLLAFNLISDLSGIACSSFAAWGRHTADGKTVAGRNLDWYWTGAIAETQFLIVQAATADRAGWAAVTWPGCVGAFTGMNQFGIAAAIHDVSVHQSVPPIGVTPRCLLVREMLERSTASTGNDDLLELFRRYHAAVGANIFVALPGKDRSGGLVFEMDSNREATNGATMRSPGAERSWIICTNHHRLRPGNRPARPSADGDTGRCDRYDELQHRIARAGIDAPPIDAENAWTLLESVGQCVTPQRRLHTLHAAVFEPDAHRMHAALSRGRRSALQEQRVTLSVDSLVDGATPDVKK